MHRHIGKVALVCSIALLGCSAADGDGSGVDPYDPEWRGDPGHPISGDTSAETGKADGPDDPGAPCPAGALCMDRLPFSHNGTTAGGSRDFDGYRCSPEIDESGPEKVYRVDVPEQGLLVASLDHLGAGVDVDVHILQQLSADTCVDRGHWDSAALVARGRFWIVVDSYVDGSGSSKEGSYELSVSLTTADDYASSGLSRTVLGAGLRGFARAWADGVTEELEYGIVDYTRRSIDPRFFVLDLREGQMVYREMVTHGSGSQDPNDATRASRMSNVEGSHSSSMGMARTAETYYGSNGYSLRIDGLEQGYNHRDRPRAIVIHPATYATQAYVDSHGYLGRSWGCPAVDPGVSRQMIDTLKNGRLVLKYFDDSSWLANSRYVAP
ncbi:MAG: murein L,D-transpeptidase catalytic domain family protein [Deltaproteobacteria bacterium]|jgi:hypothetical protein|nr:murein L,D-transpeptidase catalytic domain family protein [Deltaproteobacteria bacterium]MBW2536838.1 murein L,D-transpeptidase catalytic domain family protein [Deltaproteobacteria bacterium]